MDFFRRHTKLREYDADLIGEDTQGNKYYQNMNCQFGMYFCLFLLLVVYCLFKKMLD